MHFINKLRALDYTFKGRQKTYRAVAPPRRDALLFVPLSDNLADEWVISSLHQAGCQDDEIRTFLTAAKA